MKFLLEKTLESEFGESYYKELLNLSNTLISKILQN